MTRSNSFGIMKRCASVVLAGRNAATCWFAVATAACAAIETVDASRSGSVNAGSVRARTTADAWASGKSMTCTSQRLQEKVSDDVEATPRVAVANRFHVWLALSLGGMVTVTMSPSTGRYFTTISKRSFNLSV